MSWQICVTFEPIGTVCFDVPLLLPWVPKRPDPWMSTNLLDISTIKDLSVLATMDELASRLSNATLRKTMHATIQGAATQPKLKGAAINFKVKKASG